MPDFISKSVRRMKTWKGNKHSINYSNFLKVLAKPRTKNSKVSLAIILISIFKVMVLEIPNRILFWGVFEWKVPLNLPVFHVWKKNLMVIFVHLYRVGSQMIKVQMKHRLRMDLHKTSSFHISNPGCSKFCPKFHERRTFKNKLKSSFWFIYTESGLK